MENYFKKYTKENDPVFKNIKYLNPECLPIEFHHREEEMESIATNISPVFEGGVPVHTIILGDNATGKTTAIKKLFEQLEESMPNVIASYVDCRKYHTEYQIYRELYAKVLQKEAPVYGTNSQRLLTDILKVLEITKQPLIVALDDMNYLLGDSSSASVHSQNVIRNLTRANESYNVVIGLYPIMTSAEFKYKFEREVSTLFLPFEVCFRPYSREEYRSIIVERCGYVFYDVLPDDVLDCVVDCVVERGDVRFAWSVLKVLGLEMRFRGVGASVELLCEVLDCCSI